MRVKHQATQEEETFWRLREEAWDTLSEAARTVLTQAEGTAYALRMVPSYCFQPEDYDEAMGKMRLATMELTDREHELLVRLWCAALAAAASIDPEDFETSTGYKVYRADLHSYYRVLSSMVEETLQEKRLAELRAEHERSMAEREPIDDSDIPF